MNIGRIFLPKRVWKLSTHQSAPETALSRELLPPAHINLRSVFGKRENTGMIRTLKGPDNPPHNARRDIWRFPFFIGA